MCWTDLSTILIISSIFQVTYCQFNFIHRLIRAHVQAQVQFEKSIYLHDCDIVMSLWEAFGKQTNVFDRRDPFGCCNLPGVQCVGQSVLKLNWADQNLTGSIPPDIGKLTMLYWLSLNNNLISGNIPQEIGNLNSLTFLDLGMNRLSGSIPSLECKKLHTLILSDNQLSGSIPKTIGNLRSLTFLHLENNRLSGSLPRQFTHLKRLYSLYLHNNSFSGKFPTVLIGIKSLSSLDLSYNNLSGPLPKRLHRMKNLRVLNLCHNRLSGTFPIQIGKLRKIRYVFDVLGLNLSYLQRMYEEYSTESVGWLNPEVENLWLHSDGYFSRPVERYLQNERSRLVSLTMLFEALRDNGGELAQMVLKDSRSNPDDDALKLELLNYELILQKFDLQQDFSDQQNLEFKTLETLTDCEILKIQDEIESLKSDLLIAKEIKSQKISYDSLAKSIKKIPSRDKSARKTKKLEKEIQRLQEENDLLVKAKELRKAKIEKLITLMHDIQDEISIVHQEKVDEIDDLTDDDVDEDLMEM